MRILVAHNDGDNQIEQTLIKIVSELVNEINNIEEKVSTLKFFLFNSESFEKSNTLKIVLENINIKNREKYRLPDYTDIMAIYSEDYTKGIVFNIEEYNNKEEIEKIYLICHELTHLMLEHDKGFYLPQCILNIFGRDNSTYIGQIIKNIVHDYEVNLYLIQVKSNLVVNAFKYEYEKIDKAFNNIKHKTGSNKLFLILRIIMQIYSKIIVLNKINKESMELIRKFETVLDKLKNMAIKEKPTLSAIHKKWLISKNFDSPRDLCIKLCELWTL